MAFLPASSGNPTTLVLELFHVETNERLKRFTSSQGAIDIGRASRHVPQRAYLGDTTGLFRLDGTQVMSARHARITWSDDGQGREYVYLADLDSTNGTSIRRSGEDRHTLKPDCQYRIMHGDTITFGKIITASKEDTCRPLSVRAQLVNVPRPTGLPLGGTRPTSTPNAGWTYSKVDLITRTRTFNQFTAPDNGNRGDFSACSEEEPASTPPSSQRLTQTRPRFGLTDADLLLSGPSSSSSSAVNSDEDEGLVVELPSIDLTNDLVVKAVDSDIELFVPDLEGQDEIIASMLTIDAYSDDGEDDHVFQPVDPLANVSEEEVSHHNEDKELEIQASHKDMEVESKLERVQAPEEEQAHVGSARFSSAEVLTGRLPSPVSPEQAKAFGRVLIDTSDHEENAETSPTDPDLVARLFFPFVKSASPMLFSVKERSQSLFSNAEESDAVSQASHLPSPVESDQSDQEEEGHDGAEEALDSAEDDQDEEEHREQYVNEDTVDDDQEMSDEDESEHSMSEDDDDDASVRYDDHSDVDEELEDPERLVAIIRELDAAVARSKKAAAILAAQLEKEREQGRAKDSEVEEQVDEVEQVDPDLDQVDLDVEQVDQDVEEIDQSVDESDQDVDEGDQDLEEVDQDLAEGDQDLEEEDQDLEEIDQDFDGSYQAVKEGDQDINEGDQDVEGDDSDSPLAEGLMDQEYITLFEKATAIAHEIGALAALSDLGPATRPEPSGPEPRPAVNMSPKKRPFSAVDNEEVSELAEPLRSSTDVGIDATRPPSSTKEESEQPVAPLPKRRRLALGQLSLGFGVGVVATIWGLSAANEILQAALD